MGKVIGRERETIEQYAGSKRDYQQSTEEMLTLRGNFRGGRGDSIPSNGDLREARSRILGSRAYLKNQDNSYLNDPILLPLNELAQKVGYALKREKTSRNHIVMEKEENTSIKILQSIFKALQDKITLF